jgi:hypothetical protein
MSVPVFVRVQLTHREWAVVSRSIVGNGGHQLVLRRIVARVNRATLLVEIHPADWEKVRRYAEAYGGGGYQDRFKVLLRAFQETTNTSWGRQV